MPRRRPLVLSCRRNDCPGSFSLVACGQAPSPMSAVTYVTARILRVLPRARIGHALAQLAERPWSPTVGRTIVRLYSRAYGVALDECAGPRNWPSFDAFFTCRP